jgi:FKBP-type peptidyl-prolyl cis-trans isomerase FkpA
MKQMFSMLRNILAGLLVISAFSGCLKSATETCNANYDPCAFTAPASEIQAVQDYLTANNIQATQHCSGLFYRIDEMGTGATPNVCSNISVTYEGKLTNGTVFDAQNVPVVLNLSGVIPGWKDGIPLIKAGGRIYLYIPPSLGYGPYGSGPIPGNSVLVFRVELVAVQ